MADRISTVSPVPVAPKIKTEKRTIQSLCKCLHCGKEFLHWNDGFYQSSDSFLYKDNNGYAPICKTCVHKAIQMAQKSKCSTSSVVQLFCAILDLPFLPTIAKKISDVKPQAMIEAYMTRLENLPDSFPKSYIDMLMSGRDVVESSRREEEDLWDERSKYNKEYVLDIVGYDPFDDDALTSAHRKYLFNLMAGYCPDNSITSDSHKLQSIINIVLVQLQVHALDELINKELSQSSDDIDEEVLGKYAAMKQRLLSAIDKLADNNEISAKTTKASKGANTLSARMRRLTKDKFKGIEVNYFDVKTAKAFQQVADISMNAVCKELQFQDNDYTDIIAEQRQLIADFESKRDALEEENRLLNNENAELRHKLKIIEEGEEDEIW